MNDESQDRILRETETEVPNPNIESSGRTGNNVRETTIRSSSDNLIKMGRHGAEMIMTSDPEKNERMLSEVGLPDGMSPTTIEERLRLVKRLIATSMGLAQETETNIPDRIGFNLTNQAERDVLFGVLKLMTDTDYKGNVKVPTSEVLRRDGGGKPDTAIEADMNGYQLVATETHIGGAYENIPSTPVLIIGQSELVRAVGYDPNISSDRERVAQAVVSLATKQNFLMWTRPSRDKNGRVERKRDGKWKFEVVSTFSPVLNVRFVSDKEKGFLKHYEVSLAPVFLDEISREYGSEGDGYFLLIPQDCNREITEAYRKLFPHRVRVSPTIQSLCYWLRLQVVEIQQKERNSFSKSKPNPVLVVRYADLCRRLNIPESSFRRNPSRVRPIVEDGLRVAQEIGYIRGFSSDDATGEYRFVINFDYYPNRFKQTSQDDPHRDETPTPETEPTTPQQGTIDF